MSSQIFDIVTVLEELYRIRKPIILFVLGFSFIALLIVTFMPKEYVSDAVVLPPYQTQIGVGGMLAGIFGMFSSSAGGEFVLPFMVTPSDLYASMIKTPAVLDTVIKEFELMRDYKKRSLYDAREKFKRKLKVKQTKEGMIEVSFSHRKLKKSADVVNAVIRRLDEINKNLRIYSARNYRIYVEERLKECSDSLEVAKEELARFQKEKNIPAVEAQTEYAISNYATVAAEMLKTQYELNYLKNFMTEKNERIRTLQTRLLELEKTLASLETQGSLSTIPVGQIPELYLEYLSYFKRFETFQTLYLFLTQQYEQAKLEEAKDVPVIQVLYWATPNPYRIKPRRGLVTAIVFVSLSILAFLGVLVLASYKRYKESNRIQVQRFEQVVQKFFGESERK